MCNRLNTKQGQEFLPDFMKNLDGTQVSTDGGQSWKGVRPINRPEDVPMGDGLADAARTAIMTRRERIRQAVEGE